MWKPPIIKSYINDQGWASISYKYGDLNFITLWKLSEIYENLTWGH